jgi:hypothetical protein
MPPPKSRSSSARKSRSVSLSQSIRTPIGTTKRKRESSLLIDDIIEEDELVEDNSIHGSANSKSRRLSSSVDQPSVYANIAEEDELDQGSLEHHVSSSVRGSTLSRDVSVSIGSPSLPDIPTPTPLPIRKSPSKRWSTKESAGQSSTQLRPNLATVVEPSHLDEEDELSFEQEQSTILDATDKASETNTRTQTSTFRPSLEATRSEALHAAPRGSGQASEDVSELRTAIPAPRPSTNRKTTKRKSRVPTGDSVSVTVYRKSKRPQVDTDPLGATPIPSLNPADVLAQMLLEISSDFIDSVGRRSARNSAAAGIPPGRQRRALQAFHHILQDALFDISTAQNAVHALTGRLKKVKKERGDLQADMISLTKEREDVALRMDQVRMQHLISSKEEQETRLLAGSLTDLETAVERGRRKMEADRRTEEGFEQDTAFLFDLAVDHMSGGGLVGMVRHWNRALEEAAKVL